MKISASEPIRLRGIFLEQFVNGGMQSVWQIRQKMAAAEYRYL